MRLRGPFRIPKELFGATQRYGGGVLFGLEICVCDKHITCQFPHKNIVGAIVGGLLEPHHTGLLKANSRARMGGFVGATCE